MTKSDFTETELKLIDAATQMKLALESSGDLEIVRSCVNSYISHARSVTFVMQKESSGIPELEVWYKERQEELKSSPLLRFFNDRRVYSIHQGVVSPIQHIAKIYDVKVDGVELPGEGTMTFLKFDGVEKFIPGSSGGVFNMCEEYFLILKELVTQWRVERHKYAR